MAPGAAPPPDGVAPLLAGLAPAQREAVLADDPVVCVLAGAGAGKTRVLTLRVARRIEDGSAHPMHVLVCTFSRKAAEELRSRLWGLGAGSALTAGTFHRAALRLVGRHRADRGEPAPVVGDRRALLASVLQGDDDPRRPRGGRTAGGGPAAVTGMREGGMREGGMREGARREGAMRERGRRVVGGTSTGSREIARLDAEISWAKARLIGPDTYETAAHQAGRRPGIAAGRVAELYERYEVARRRRGVMDLDDLLWHCGDLLESDPAFAGAVRWWHRHLFVDEAQDMNEAQYRLLCLLAGDEPDLFAVGDPNQSVYGWNGADPALLRRITDQFAGTRVVRLDANHRCTPQVVTAAAAVLDLAGPTAPVSTRADGPLPRIACLATDADEAAWVARQVWRAHRPGRRWSSIAVLARTNAQLERIALALGAEHVPHRTAGTDLGPASDVERADGTAPAAARRSGPNAATAGSLRGGRGERGEGTGDAGTDDAAMDDATMDGTAAAVAARGGAGTAEGRGRPWEPGAGAEGRAERGVHPDDDRVVLSTFHRAKGLQWPVVFIVGLADGTVPLVSARSRAARAEERRLLYVALTRAEDELVCTWARHADDVGAASGEVPRSASPWLEPVQRAVEELRRGQKPPAPGEVADHLARIRQLLPTAAPGGTAGAP